MSVTKSSIMIGHVGVQLQVYISNSLLLDTVSMFPTVLSQSFPLKKICCRYGLVVRVIGVINNSARHFKSASCPSYFEITHTISPWIVFDLVQLSWLFIVIIIILLSLLSFYYHYKFSHWRRYTIKMFVIFIKMTLLFSFFSVIKAGSVCKMLAQKLPVQLVERFKDSLAKKIALGRY